MTVPQEDVDRKLHEAHRALDEIDHVVARVRVAVDDLLEAIQAAQERQRRQ